MEDFIIDKYLVEPWKLYLDECLYDPFDCDILTYDDDLIWRRLERVQTFEEELDERKNQHERKHGQQKSLRELCEEYRLCLTEYLSKCISLHSTVSTPILIDSQ